MGQHAGIVQIQLHVSGWVNITGMVGQHETEWWVNMVRNLHFGEESLPPQDSGTFGAYYG